MKRFLILLFVTMLVGKVLADDNYDFSAVCSSGQTLYYKITSSTVPYEVKVTYPNYYINEYSEVNYYYNYTKPTGYLIIPEVVTYNEDTYSVTSIDNGAFADCSNLTSITIPNSVTSIGSFAFYRVKNIVYSGIATADSWESNWGARTLNGIIEGDFIYADAEKTQLTAYIGNGSGVTIPKTVTNIGKDAFVGNSFTSIIIESNADFRSTSLHFEKDGIWYLILNKNSVAIIKCNDSSGDVVIPASVTFGNTFIVTEIYFMAFYNCDGMTSITIPNSVTTIGFSAFENCSGLTSVSIPNSVQKIASDAFNGCDNLHYNEYDNALYLGNDENPYVALIKAKSIYITACEVNSKCKAILSDAFIGCGNIAIIAKDDEGCHFVQWSDGVTVNPRALRANEYILYTAEFSIETHTVTLSAENGTVTGNGTYDYATEVEIIATPKEGYHFVKWNDGSIENPRVIIVKGDLSFTAIFEKEGGQGGNENQNGENLNGNEQNGNENQGGSNEGNENQGGENTNPGTAVAETAANVINIYAHHNTIIVENATDEIRVYNAMGALVCRDAIHRVRAELQVNGAGVYIVKVGTVAKRVMIND